MRHFPIAVLVLTLAMPRVVIAETNDTMASKDIEFSEVFFDALTANAQKHKQTPSEILQTYGIMFFEGSTATFLPESHAIRVRLTRSQLENLQQFSDVTREYSPEEVKNHFEKIEDLRCFPDVDKAKVEADSVRKTIRIDGEPFDLTEAAQKTLKILKTEKFEKITIDLVEPHKAFETLKALLATHGVTVRLKRYLSPRNYEPGESIRLRTIPLDKFMEIFDGCVHWGWIIYPDGSITYFDNQCGCCWPQNFGCHKSQYDAGKPEVMEKEANANPKIQKQNKAEMATPRKPSD